MAQSDIQTILDFWLEDVGPKGWYIANDAVDKEIRERFSGHVSQALDGAFDSWTETPQGTLALLILLDQFPRNLYRGSAQAFSGDPKALKIAERAVSENQDMEIPEPERQFFYMPFEHSEDRAHQDYCLGLFTERMNLPDEKMMHVEKHREVIYRFGRFPYRNEALGREPTPEETEYLEQGGYTPQQK